MRLIIQLHTCRMTLPYCSTCTGRITVSHAHNSNTTYTWDPTTGQEFIDDVGQGAPYRNFVLMTVWDGGGNDNYDFSNYTTNLSIDLNPGEWIILDTSTNKLQRADLGNNQAGGAQYFARGNIANALIDPNNSAETALLIENVTGGSGDDVLIGNVVANVLNGGLGRDTTRGGQGNDTYYVDNGGDNVIEFANEGTVDLVYSSLFSYTLGDNIEDLSLINSAVKGTGSILSNTITGNEQDNLLDGKEGDDTLYGENGNDTLDGGLGNDSMLGGAGNDIYSVESAMDKVTESVNRGRDTVTSSITYTLGENLENLTLTGKELINGMGNNLENIILSNDAENFLFGDAGKDILSGGDGDDTLDGGIKSDVMSGGLGNDIYIVDSSTDQVVENENEGIETVNASSNYALSNNLENLNLTGSNTINGRGNDLSNIINGNDAVNYIYAGEAADFVNGAAGDDYIYGEVGNDSILGGKGDDNLNGRLGDDVISGS